jgi:hypothetical protein
VYTGFGAGKKDILITERRMKKYNSQKDVRQNNVPLPLRRPEGFVSASLWLCFELDLCFS